MRLIRIRISDAHRSAATALSQTRPIYRGSHRGERANIVGALGEVIAIEYLTNGGLMIAHDDVTTHDLRFATGRTLEIKTKDRTVAPLAHYECSVPLYNHDHQRPDYYLFVSLQRPRDVDTSVDAFHTGYICGAASQQQVERAQERSTGEIDPANGTRFWTACRNIPIADLVYPAEALKRWLIDASPASEHAR